MMVLIRSALRLFYVICPLLLQLAALQTVSGTDAAAMSGVPSDAALSSATGFPEGSVTKMEDNIRTALDGDIKCISMLRTLKLYLERMGADVQQVRGHGVDCVLTEVCWFSPCRCRVCTKGCNSMHRIVPAAFPACTPWFFLLTHSSCSRTLQILPARALCRNRQK